MKVAGIMSGTSLDGIDVAIAEITGRGARQQIRVAAFGTAPYPEQVRAALLGVSNATAHVAEVARLHVLLAELYASAFHAVCRAKGVDPATVELIGCHGQTIYHQGIAAPFLGQKISTTLQIGDGSFLAELTGTNVVSDFRMRDMAAGGQGAPLVPFLDYVVYRHPKKTRVALNLGGIANIAYLPAGAGPEAVVAFDTGPANMVMDQLVERFSNGRKHFDENGDLAVAGKVDRKLLNALLRDPYYRKKPPKSAGREQYGPDLVDQIVKAGLPPADAIATATALTAVTVARAIQRFCPGAQEVIASGGGVHNLALMAMISQQLAPITVAPSGAFGVNPDAKEAVAFALMAYETWHGRPSNVPSATGARKPVILGKISKA